MSSSADSENAEIIAFYESLFINTCLPIAVLTFLSYECLITFDREVALFWWRKATGASVLFFANRYLPVLVQVLNISVDIRRSDASCNTYIKALQCIQLLQYLPWAAFSALRTFALSGRNWTVSTSVFLLSMVPFGVNLSQYRWLQVVNDPSLGCNKTSTVPFEIAKRLTITSRSCLMAADVIVLLVTWNSSLSTVRMADVALRGRPSFARMLLRDGTIYFVILLILNTLHLTFTMLSITNDALSPVSYFTTFTEPITAVLVSRFLLNLQHVNRYHQHSKSATLTRSISVDFARVIGSLGSSLDSSGDESSNYTSSDATRADQAGGGLWSDCELGILAPRAGSISSAGEVICKEGET